MCMFPTGCSEENRVLQVHLLTQSPTQMWSKFPLKRVPAKLASKVLETFSIPSNLLWRPSLLPSEAPKAPRITSLRTVSIIGRLDRYAALEAHARRKALASSPKLTPSCCFRYSGFSEACNAWRPALRTPMRHRCVTPHWVSPKRLEPNAISLEALALRLEAIALRLE